MTVKKTITFVTDEDGRHNDHGLTGAHLKVIESAVESKGDGFFMLSVELPEDCADAPCGLYGPTSGDAPVEDSECEGFVRGIRRWVDRTVDKPFRPSRHLVAIGIIEGDVCTLFTGYGSIDGTIAPQAPDDPNAQDPEGSLKFWSEHALTRRPVSQWVIPEVR